MPSDECLEELEIVASIFVDEFTIKENKEETVVSMVLYPSTGDDEESKNVTITLELHLSSKYPFEIPMVHFRNPRGVSDERLDALMAQLKDKSLTLLGNSMIFEFITLVKEFLTENNRPALECPICLIRFEKEDAFYRSPCFHHFHSLCLGQYLASLVHNNNDLETPISSHIAKEAEGPCCPVCRKELPGINIESLLAAPPPAGDIEESQVPENWVNQQESLGAMFEKQRQQGGIIDLTKQVNLLVISSPQEVSSTPQEPEEPTTSAPSPKRQPRRKNEGRNVTRWQSQSGKYNGGHRKRHK